MLPKAIIAAMLAVALGVPAGITLTTGGLGPLRFSGSNPEGATAELPHWKAGDTWTYALSGFSQAPRDHARFQGNLTLKVEGIVNKTKAGLTEDAYNLTLTGDLKGREQVRVDDGQESSSVVIDRPVRFNDLKADISGKALVGTEDLALIMEQVDITGGAKRGNVSLSFSIDVMNRFTPALPLLKFPLKVGETWAQDVQVKSVGSVAITLKGPMGTFTDTKTWDLTFVVNRTARVTAFGNATVPAGTFTAFKVVSHRAEDRDRDREVKDDDREDRENETNEDRGVDVEDSQMGAQHMASSMASHDDARPMGLLRFSPAGVLLYSPEVKNVVGFRIHMPGPLGKTKVVGELKSFHLG